MVKVIRLEDEDGEVIEEVVGLPKFLPDSMGHEFPLLQYVDPWGDTIFNQPQAKALLSEWERLKSIATQHGQHDLWLAVKQLIAKSQAEPHLYLRFEGD